MHIWLMEAVWLITFAERQYFPTTKKYILFNYNVGWLNIENGKPHLNPN